MMRRHSPYNYAFDNPVRFIDPDGMGPNDANERIQAETRFQLSGIGSGDPGDDPKKKKAKLPSDGPINYMQAGQGAAAGFDNSTPFPKGENEGESAEIILGFTPIGEAADIATFITGKNPYTGETVSWGWRTAGLIPFVSEVKAAKNITKAAQGGVKLIGPAGDAGAKVVKQIPEGWVMKNAKKDGGTRFIDPTNSGNHVRVMSGNPSSPFVNSQTPYVIRYINGSPVNSLGNVIPTPNGVLQNKAADLHVPIEQFIFH